MKKLLLTLLCTIGISIININGVTFAQNINKVAVFSADTQENNIESSIYPDSTQFVAYDIMNSLSDVSSIALADANKLHNRLVAQGLYKDYNEILKQYRERHIIDYLRLTKLSKELGIDKILLVSSGFNTQNMVFKDNYKFKWSLSDPLMPISQDVEPYYEFNISVLLIEPYSERIIWQNTYKKNFVAFNINNSSSSFQENSGVINKIKKYSLKTSLNIGMEIENILNLENPVEAKNIQINTVSLNQAESKESNEYKEWINNNPDL